MSRDSKNGAQRLMEKVYSDQEGFPGVLVFTCLKVTLPSHFVKDVVKFIASCNISKACVEVFFGELTCSLLKQIHSLTDNMT